MQINEFMALSGIGNYNDVMSRAYYAFFDAATAALLSKDLFAKTHHGVAILFENNFIKTGAISKIAGRLLARARKAREEADYEVFKKFTKEETEIAIKAANEFVAEIEKVIRIKKITLS